MKTLLLLLAVIPSLMSAAEPAVMEGHYSRRDFVLTSNPNDPNWRVAGIFAEKDRDGNLVPGHRTEIRARWTRKNLYFFFICPYDVLHLRPESNKTAETNQLWNWDVAEVFLGADFQHIRQYREFEVSPQGEWVDLDIDRDHAKPEGGWKWDSGFEVKAHIDSAKKVWYAAMRIPIQSIGPKEAKAGQELRINLFRCQGQDPDRKYIAWQTPHNPSFHTPEVFGILKLAPK